MTGEDDAAPSAHFPIVRRERSNRLPHEADQPLRGKDGDGRPPGYQVIDDLQKANGQPPRPPVGERLSRMGR